VERIVEFLNAAIGAAGRRIKFGGTFHVEGFVGPIVVELF
jgi:hypothetical protein